MKQLLIRGSLLMFLLAGLVVFTSCEKNNGNDLPEDTLILNNWIWEGMNEVYLWEAFIPDLNPKSEPDPEAFFYKLLYEDDRNSWIVDDYETLVAMFDGVELANGMSLYPVLYTENQVVSYVEYVTDGSPAADSGILRGDILYTVDGNILTRDNYFELSGMTTATFGFADWDGTALNPNGIEIQLTAIELNRNPIIHHEVIDYEGYKVGYLVYTQFTSGENGEWLDALKTVFESFKTAGVSDVVLDLRYNPGGSLGISAYMASTLAPAAAMENNEVFVELVWNDFYNQYWADADLDEDGEADGLDSEQLRIPLPQSDQNLNLSKVYFLTTGGTASASESLMSGLYPYMEVIQIGTTSYGKCYASITVDDWEEPKRHNWAMQPLVIKYSNAEGFTDFQDGIEPDIEVQDNLLYAKPFGSLEDPLLARALEEITHVAPAARKSVYSGFNLKSLPVPRKPIQEWQVDLPKRK
jgi:carboxyl-terminal processing protease